MISRNNGRILQLGSEVSKAPTPLMAVYAATKAFVLSFSEALINELKDTKVTLTVLMPCATDTDFFDKASAEDSKVYREAKLDKPEVAAETGYKAMMKGERRAIGPAAIKNVMSATVMPDHVVADNMRKNMAPGEKGSKEVRTEPEHKRSKEVRDKSKGQS